MGKRHTQRGLRRDTRGKTGVRRNVTAGTDEEIQLEKGKHKKR